MIQNTQYQYVVYICIIIRRLTYNAWKRRSTFKKIYRRAYVWRPQQNICDDGFFMAFLVNGSRTSELCMLFFITYIRIYFTYTM